MTQQPVPFAEHAVESVSTRNWPVYDGSAYLHVAVLDDAFVTHVSVSGPRIVLPTNPIVPVAVALLLSVNATVHEPREYPTTLKTPMRALRLCRLSKSKAAQVPLPATTS